MRKLLAGIGSGLLLLGVPANWAQENVSTADLMKIIQEQNRKIDALTQRLQALESRQAPAAGGDTSQVKTVLMETNEALAATNKRLDGLDKRLVLGKGIEGLKLTGDLRLRYEMRDQDFENYAASETDSKEDRGRFRTRFRLGMVWQNPTEAWEIGAGLATGGDDGRSTNDTWGETNAFETGDIRLDYAYAKHKWDVIDGLPLSLCLGQQKNPFVTTYMLWDGDLRPTGVTLQLGDPKGKNYAGAFLTAGAYDVLWGPNLNKTATNDYDVYMLAAQAGYAFKSDPVNALAAVGIYHITPDSLYDVTGVSIKFATSPGLYNMGLAEDYGFDVVDLYLEATTSVAGIEVKPYVHGAMNLSADGDVSQQNLESGEKPDENDMAGLVGLSLKRGKWKLGYSYAYIGADAVFGPLKDSDFGETAGLMDTDIMGHKLGLSYNFTKNMNVGITGYLLDRINGGSDETAKNEADSTTCMQLDAVYKF